MLTRQGLAQDAVDGVLSTRVHPHTGEPIVPVGRRKNGRPIWPVMGASDDDGDDGDGDGADGDGDGDEDEDDDEDDKESRRSRKERRQDKKLAEENARRRTENKKLQEQLDAQGAKLKEYEDADKGELEKLKESVVDLEKENTRLAALVSDQGLQIAFLSNSSYKWKDPEATLRLADLSEVEIDDEGNVEGLDEALKKLAEGKKYLVDEGDSEDEDPPRRTGEPPKRRKPKGTAQRDKLVNKYPALRR